MPTATGIAVGLAGIGFVGAGLRARRDVRGTLAQEHVSADGGPSGHGRVVTAGGARSLAELIRRNTISATSGRTYAEVAPYVDPAGNPTSDRSLAATDEMTGRPVENPDHELWIQSTTLQTALMQAYMAFRVSELTIALGAALVAIGIGVGVGGRTPDGR